MTKILKRQFPRPTQTLKLKLRFLSSLVLLSTLYLLLPVSFTYANQQQEDTQNLVKMQAKIFTAKPQQHFLGLYFKNQEGWHTYWKNPGDAGTPLLHSFKMGPQVLSLEAMEWLPPSRFLEQGNMQAFGYGKNDDYAFFFALPENTLKKLQNKELTIHSKWLICKHICIPGERIIKGQVRGENFLPQSSSINPATDLNLGKVDEEKLFQLIPQKGNFPSELDVQLSLSEDGAGLVLYYSLKGVTKDQVPKDKNLLTPFPAPLFTFKHEELYLDEKKQILYGKLPIDWDGAYADEGPIELPKDGQFKKPYTLQFLYSGLGQDGQTNSIEKTFKQFLVTGSKSHQELWPASQSPLSMVGGDQKQDSQVAAIANANRSLTSSEDVKKKLDEPPTSYLLYLFLAFIGGFILNFMPCVLPVISLKLFSLAKISKSAPQEILRHNLFYTLGVLCSFMVLGGAVILLKLGGEEVGWGFHLQSPSFVALMIFILFLLSLNLFGLFDFSVPGGRLVGNVPLRGGHWGDFSSGVLSTILSTPCSAPFLGTALTFAFTSSSLTILLIFFMIGLGLATPFLLTGIFPQLISFLPRPGAWMEGLKKILGLILLLTLIWLYDVFLNLTDSSLFPLKINMVLLFLFFALYYRKHMGKKKKWEVLLWTLNLVALISLFSSLWSPAEMASATPSTSTSTSSSSSFLSGPDLPWKKWSEQALLESKAKKELVFMDFTAKWCFTCKVNEKLVINTQNFKKLAQEYSLQLLLADWTKRDPLITKWLKNYNIIGVPAYFIQDRQGTIIPLGETITIQEIREALAQVK